MVLPLLLTLACAPAAHQADPAEGAGATGTEAVEEVEPVPEAASAPLEGPTVIALGIAQDGGLPHAGCSCTRCEAARRDPARRGLVASLGLVIPQEDGAAKVYLLDATPDVAEQIRLLRPYREWPEGRVDRTPVDGVMLTHAHMGHYLGLAHFGYEVMHASGVSGYCTPRMATFLRTHAPWSQLIEKEELEIVETEPGRTVELPGGVSFTPIQVPHRDELSDTVGYLLRGPKRTLFYVPDTDSWRAWDQPLPEFLKAEGVDVLLPDATFYSLEELPGRSVESIGHPLMTDTMELLGGEVEAGRLEVFFTHLNHSNPALEPDSAARAEVEARGFAVLKQGQRITL